MIRSRITAMTALLLATMGLTTGGCVEKRVEKVAVHSAGDEKAILDGAPRSGMYHVQLLAGNSYVKSPAYETDRWFAKGDRMGFREDADGSLIAIAHDDEIKYPALPANVTHAMWFHKSKRETQFGKEVRKAGDTLAAAVVVTGVAVVGTAAVVAIVKNPDVIFDDDCDDEFSSSHYKHGHHSKYR